MSPHPYAGTPQYTQAYPPPREGFYLLASYGRKKLSGAAATAVRGSGWHKLGHARPTVLG